MDANVALAPFGSFLLLVLLGVPVSFSIGIAR